LEHWFRYDLPGILATRKHLTRADLKQMMEFKLAREKWRPRLVSLIESNSEEAVVEVTTRSIEGCDIDAPRKAMEVLCELKGVGPATASLILSAIFPDRVPFLTDEASEILGLGKPDYTHKAYAAYFDAIRERAKAATEGDVGRLERACWAYATLEKLEGADEPPAKKRRKA
jgi:hypothetical protein